MCHSCRVPLYVRVVDDESGTAEAASANEPDSAVPEAFYGNTLGKRLGGRQLAVVFRAAKDCPLEHLPENTSLQRSMKEYLKNGGAVGVAEAVWDGSHF